MCTGWCWQPWPQPQAPWEGEQLLLGWERAPVLTARTGRPNQPALLLVTVACYVRFARQGRRIAPGMLALPGSRLAVV